MERERTEERRERGEKRVEREREVIQTTSGKREGESRRERAGGRETEE